MKDTEGSPGQLQARERSVALKGVQGEDFSGSDFSDTRIEGQNFFESIFNGCNLSNIRAGQSIFQHAEFTETRFTDCVFEDTSFDHSDFVLSDIRNTKFTRCSFQNAEWRDVVFTDVDFQQCIFRNTTTSLVHFRRCSFDPASAASFIGRSKRFSLFTFSNFELPSSQLEFLRTNFGLTSQARISEEPTRTDDPFFDLSYLRYIDGLTSREFYNLFTEALARVAFGGITANRLRLKYLGEICKILLEENFLSIFAIQLLQRKLSEEARLITDKTHLLEIFALIVTLNAAINERILAVEEECADLGQLQPTNLRISMAFERDYGTESIQTYLDELGRYCGISSNNIRIVEVKKGSTLAEILITAPAVVLDVFRFFRYSLSLATVTVDQAQRLKAALSNFSSHKPPKKIRTRSRHARASRKRNTRLMIPPPKLNSELATVPSEEAAQIQIFVDAVKEQVLLVDGKVRITISMV